MMPYMPAMPRLLALALSLATLLVTHGAEAAPKKKYHFELAAVNPKADLKPDVAKAATSRVEAQVGKAFETHPQLVGKLDGAPDWKTAAEPYRKFLAKHGLAGAFLVTVDITEASEELVPMEGKPNAQRLVVRVAIHMLGENMPGRTMGFTGDGKATIKQEIGKTLHERDRQFAWDSAAEAAIADAMVTVFKQLAIPQKKQ
ncbi:MAG: hypothetical protein H6Q90_3933 [Deltaproteobacteria bacterium]|nr:hypothetical protein [Deltaproteobacteria bacterium]